MSTNKIHFGGEDLDLERRVTLGMSIKQFLRLENPCTGQSWKVGSTGLNEINYTDPRQCLVRLLFSHPRKCPIDYRSCFLFVSNTL